MRRAERQTINFEYAATKENSSFGTLSKKKSKLQADDRFSRLWTQKAATMVVVGARVSAEELRQIGSTDDQTDGADRQGNCVLKGDGYFEAVRHTWKKIFGSIHANQSEDDLDML